MSTNCISLIDLPSPPWKGKGKEIESLVRKAFHQFSLALDPNIAIALSGGKDSLTLLFFLIALSGHGFPPFRLHAFHVQGEFSCGPSLTAQYLKDLCAKVNIPLTLLEEKTPLAKRECYSCSRIRRTLLFEGAKAHGFKTIAFGHHLDDNIQTLLMNLFQKGEFAANLPKLLMHHYQITIIRPLILVKEKEILAFAKEYDFLRMMCQCPIGQNSMRKKVKTLIDTIENYFPHVRTNLSLGAEIYGSDKAKSP